jgi:hypothetical protein
LFLLCTAVPEVMQNSFLKNSVFVKMPSVGKSFFGIFCEICDI